METQKPWYKNKYSWMLIAVLLLTFGIRMFYLIQNPNQPAWYDESEYGSMAKHFALGTTPWENQIRTPYFPMLISPFFYFGAGEIGVKIFEILLITASVFLIYLITRKLYDEQIAIITSALSSVFWVTIFWGIRTTTDIPALFFQLLTLLFFVKYLEDGLDRNLILTALFMVLAFLMRTQSVLLIAVLLIVFLLMKGKDLLKPKWIITGIIGLVGGITFLLTMGKKLIVNPNFNLPIGWSALNFINIFLNPFLMGFFYFGLLALIINLVLTYDMLNSKKETIGDLIMLLIMLVWFGFFVFYIRASEDRWLLLTFVPIFVLVSRALVIIGKGIAKYSKVIAVIFVVAMLGIGGYYELKQADGIVNAKKDAYSQVMKAGLWIKANSNPNDTVVSASQPQNIFYSERKTYDFYFDKGVNQTEDDFNRNLKIIKPRYIVLSAFEPVFTPAWAFSWPEKHQDILNPVMVYYADAQKTQPILIIFEVMKND